MTSPRVLALRTGDFTSIALKRFSKASWEKRLDCRNFKPLHLTSNWRRCCCCCCDHASLYRLPRCIRPAVVRNVKFPEQLNGIVKNTSTSLHLCRCTSLKAKFGVLEVIRENHLNTWSKNQAVVKAFSSVVGMQCFFFHLKRIKSLNKRQYISMSVVVQLCHLHHFAAILPLCALLRSFKCICANFTTVHSSPA